MEAYLRGTHPEYFLRADGMVDWSPTADVTETSDAFVIKAEIPGVNKENLSVSIEHGVLTISGERKHEMNEAEQGKRHIERYYGSFSRSFTLPDNINVERINADYTDGVLSVTIPKMDAPKADKIDIKLA